MPVIDSRHCLVAHFSRVYSVSIVETNKRTLEDHQYYSHISRLESANSSIPFLQVVLRTSPCDGDCGRRQSFCTNYTGQSCWVSLDCFFTMLGICPHDLGAEGTFAMEDVWDGRLPCGGRGGMCLPYRSSEHILMPFCRFSTLVRSQR